MLRVARDWSDKTSNPCWRQRGVLAPGVTGPGLKLTPQSGNSGLFLWALSRRTRSNQKMGMNDRDR
jgi:hypothetical protein